jgi:2-hydroxy-3-oxopropionate reductase
MKIGFVGLGIMGHPMALNLIKGGHQLYVYGKRTCPTPVKEAGATVCDTLKSIAEQSEIVIVMVPDTPDVADLLFSPDGVAAGLSAGKLVVDMSSISPIETKKFAAEIAKKGCGYVDAPVSGGEVGAKAASLTIMCGGSQKDFDRVNPLFELMGKNITLVGDVGAGQTTKVANQIIVALNIEAVAEALVFASKAGADPARVRQALMGGFAASRILEVHGERMVKRTFDPGFRIELHQKDLNLALQGGKALGVALPNTASAQQLFSACVAHGGKAWDHSAMVRALELMAGHEIGGKSG